jgi:MFS family permease
VALLASFTTFAVGFMARPLGAVLFGHLGDRLGRKHAFAVALILMGTGTTLIGLLPTYRVAGIFAPIALTVLRFAQGLANGGQWGGGVLLAIESAPSSKRGFYGSIAQAGTPIGVAVANLALLLVSEALPPEAFLAYGWRIPFLLSIALVGLGIVIHRRLEETAAFREFKASNPADRSPVLEAFRLYPRLILLAVGANVTGMMGFYVLITYVVAFGTSVAGLHLPRGILLGAVLTATLVMAPAVLLAGRLSDRWGCRRIFVIGTALSGAWGFVIFPLIETRSPPLIDVAVSVGLFINALVYGSLAALFTDLFPTKVRYSAISLAYQVSSVLGGGLTPILATAMFARYHSNLALSIYVAGVCLVSLACLAGLSRAQAMDEAVHGATVGT